MTPLRIKKWLTVFVATAAIGALGACGSNSTETGTESGTSAAAGADIPAYVSTLADTHADENDGDYDASKASTIKLADGATKVTAGSDGGKAKVSGDVVTISTAGTYLISGTLSDGQIVVNSEADGKVVLVLDGANVTSGTTSPIQVIQADETVVVLADGSTNTLADSAKSGADDEEDDAPNATLWSADDLTIAGTGTLNVKGLSNDAITSKDGLVILSGKINVDAVDDGIRGKDYLVVADGTINVDADGDGFKSDKDSFDTADDETEADLGSVAILGGKISIAAGDDGVHAEGGLTVSAGTIDISKSEEGLEGAAILISGG
ncbi:MAG TPA: carbohydrate-binding domain-containing protein, partial [Aeromicrobium sp.]|nr:carbohydrate-binding domain-containing protein [Aeromicrobium sp.]